MAAKKRNKRKLVRLMCWAILRDDRITGVYLREPPLCADERIIRVDVCEVVRRGKQPKISNATARRLLREGAEASASVRRRFDKMTRPTAEDLAARVR